MPHKINFTVIHASGEDEKHPASDLNTVNHGPLVQGWISPKFCLYPVDIVLKFDKKTLLNKVQILSHQYLIASKIEFYIGDSADDSDSPDNAKYTRLGYVELSSNERTDFKARELKSVHVDAAGQFLKFVFHKNHVNKLNLYNQVGIIAINAIGTDQGPAPVEQELKNYDADPSIVAAINRPDYVSPLDDLAFAMYQDPEISQIIRNLDKKKTECVLGEKYDEAKKLKQAISELYKIGERLARYDIEKRQAIENEDYEKAKAKKQQMQEYRAETYKQLQKHNLLDFIDIESRNKLVKETDNMSLRVEIKHFARLKKNESPRALRNSKDSKLDNGNTSRSNSPPLGIMKTSSNMNNQNDESSPTFITQDGGGIGGEALTTERVVTPYEDRLIPTLRNKSRLDKHDGGRATGIGGGGVGGSVVGGAATNLGGILDESGYGANLNGDEADLYDPTTDGTEEMTERDIREAAQMNDSLGKQIVNKLYSKNFQNREEAIQEAFQNLNNFKGDKEEAKSLMKASAILAAKMIKDNVFSVFNNALKLLQFILNDYSKKHGITKIEYQFAVERCLPVLMNRTGDTNARLRQRAHEFIVEMALYQEVKPLHTVPHHITLPMKPHCAPRLALSRVEIVDELMKKLGTKDNGLTVENVSKFCAYALEHNSGDVRELATKIIIQMYKEYGHKVRNHLPQDNEMNRRNKKYRIIYEAFDKIDGKPYNPEEKHDQKKYDNNTEALKKEIKLIRDNQRQSRNTNDNSSIITPRRTKTPSKTKQRGVSNDRKTPLSIADESDFNPDNTCIFCAEKNEKFVKEGLELHYWKVCPMLRRCHECKQVIEVAAQSEHLLTECEYKSSYKKCPRCFESVHTQEQDYHFKQKQCTQITDQNKFLTCPLCHKQLPNSDEGWKDHLMGNGNNSCTKNSRKNDAKRAKK